MKLLKIVYIMVLMAFCCHVQAKDVMQTAICTISARASTNTTCSGIVGYAAQGTARGKQSARHETCTVAKEKARTRLFNHVNEECRKYVDCGRPCTESE